MAIIKFNEIRITRMKNIEKLYEELKKFHKIKKKEIRVSDRKNRQSPDERSIIMTYGSVWGIQDSSVPFDDKREDIEIKQSLRPCLVLETPDRFGDYDEVHMAPGTRKPHRIGEKNPLCLMAKQNDSQLKETTYFLINFSWYAIQKNLEKKFGDITGDTRKYLDSIMRRLQNEE